MSEVKHQSFWSSRARWVLCGFLIVIGFFLLTEHTAHVLQVLPWLLFAACPLMHLFMHRGHSHDEHDTEAPHEHDQTGDTSGGPR
jgi:hypothetical protein